MSKLQSSMTDSKAWERYCDILKEAGGIILHPDSPNDAMNQAEGFRYLSRLSRTALEIFVEHADPLFPVLYRPAHETVKMGADNPDNYYQKAAISGQYEYRIKGHRGSVYYLGFGTQASNYGKDGKMGPTGYLEGKDLLVEPDGSFEIVVSCESKPGNWLPMSPDTETLIVRQTFSDRSNETIADLSIERIGGNDLPAAIDPEQFVLGLQQAANFVLGTARLFSGWSKQFRQKPNQLPAFDQELSLSVGGDPNIYYYHGYWELADDEVLLIETEVPNCEFWNFQLNNYWMESLDFRYYPICINQHGATISADGKLRIYVSHYKLDVDNWLSTAEHCNGTMCLRWIRAQHYPEPRLCVLKAADIKNDN